MLAGIFVFSVNDALGKWLVATYSVGQVLLIRSGAALLVLAPFIWREGGEPFREAPNALACRSSASCSPRSKSPASTGR